MKAISKGEIQATALGLKQLTILYHVGSLT